MNPAMLLILALFTPFLLIITVFLPPYLGVLGASYIIYMKKDVPHPLDDRLTDVFYIVDVYQKLFGHWVSHVATMDLLSVTLPMVLLPLSGLALAFYLTRKIVRKLIDVFTMAAS